MAIYLIALMCTVNHIAYAGSRVAVSLYALTLGASQVTIGVIMALYALCPMVLAIYFGKLADRIGPRLPMMMGTACLTAALLLPPFFPGLAILYILAPLVGTSFCLFFVAVTAIAGGIGGEGNRLRNYAMISLGFSGASFVGPMTAGFSIDHLGHLPTFILLASFPVASLLVLLFRAELLPHAAKREGADEKRNSLDLWRIPTLRSAFIASGIISSGNDLFSFYMPVYGYAIGLSASVIGTVVGFCALAAFVIRLALPRLTKLAGEARILSYAIFLAAGGFVLIPFFQNAYVLAAIAFLLGLGLGCGLPLSMSLIYALSPPGRMAESSGLRTTVNNFTHVVIPLFFGSLGAAFGFFPVFVSNSAVLIAGGMILRRSRSQESGV